MILYLTVLFSFMFCHNFRLRNRKLRQNGADIFCTTGLTRGMAKPLCRKRKRFHCADNSLTRGMAKPLFHRFNTRGYYYYAPSGLYNHSSVRRIYSSCRFNVNKFFKSALYVWL